MNTVASLPDRLRWMLDDCRNLGINEQTVNLDVIEQAAAALATPAVEGGIKLRKLSDGEWIVRIGDGQIPELFDTPQSALAAALDCLGIATPEQPGSAVQGEKCCGYCCPACGRCYTCHRRALDCLADSLTTPPPAPAAEQAQPEARGVEGICKGTNCSASKENGHRHSSECLFDHARAVASGAESFALGITLNDDISYVDWRGQRINLAAASTPNPVRAEQPEGKGAEFRGLDVSGRPVYGHAKTASVTATPISAPAAPVWLGVVDELLTNIKRSCVRGRNAADPTPENSSFIATFDHIEDLAQQAKRALTPPAAAPRVAKVGCEGNDGLLRVHPENETCDVCIPAASEDDGMCYCMGPDVVCDNCAADREAAEQAYTVTAFDYERAPVGSRDWMLFWKGWQEARRLAASGQGVEDMMIPEVSPNGSDEDMLKYLDELLAAQGTLMFARGNYNEDQAEGFGVAILDFMRLYGMRLRAKLAAAPTQEKGDE